MAFQLLYPFMFIVYISGTYLCKKVTENREVSSANTFTFANNFSNMLLAYMEKQPKKAQRHFLINRRLATLLKKSLWHRCFPVNFAKFLRTPFLQNTSGGCFWINISSRRILTIQ